MTPLTSPPPSPPSQTPSAHARGPTVTTTVPGSPSSSTSIGTEAVELAEELRGEARRRCIVDDPDDDVYSNWAAGNVLSQSLQSISVAVHTASASELHRRVAEDRRHRSLHGLPPPSKLHRDSRQWWALTARLAFGPNG